MLWPCSILGVFWSVFVRVGSGIASFLAAHLLNSAHDRLQ